MGRRGRLSRQMAPALALMLGSFVLAFALVIDGPLWTFLFEGLFFVGLAWVLWLLIAARRRGP